ncbi:MAG: uracil-DNA glycosylase [Verrucomicrobiae bacterium]|nr:uracil-DNA glycosylase [Verrucomicrobiae bacterium]
MILFLEQERAKGVRFLRLDPDLARAWVEGAGALDGGRFISAVAVPARVASSGAGVSAKRQALETLRAKALACAKCPHLARTRTQVVFGVGNPEAELMFIGEAPGADEDRQGEPFVGRAGQLLTKVILAMGMTREEVYIGNVLKCRPDVETPSGNRKPTPAEMATCLPWLREQIGIIAPRVLVALGDTAVKGLCSEISTGITRLRGKWLDFDGIPLMPTFHPAYLLRNPSPIIKRQWWEDMLAVLEKLQRPITEKQRGYFRSIATPHGES